MTDTDNPTPRKWTLRNLLSGGLIGAALVIAGGFWLSNAESTIASECALQESASAAIDEVATGQLAALIPTGKGRGYSTLAFVDAEGQPKTLADFSGKPILVNFWATWCVPCRQEMPALDTLASLYQLDVFEVVPINLDLGDEGIGKARAFLEEENLDNLTLLADPTYGAFDLLVTNAVAIGLPATLLLDSAGCEIAVLQGPAEWSSPDAINVINALIDADTAAG